MSLQGHDVQIFIQQKSLSKTLAAFPPIKDFQIRQLPEVPILSSIAQAVWNAFLSKSKNPDSWLGSGVDLATLVVHGSTSPLWFRARQFDSILFVTSFTAGYVISSIGKRFGRRVMYTHDSPMAMMAKSYWKFRGSSALSKYESYVTNSCDGLSSISQKISDEWEESYGMSSTVIHPGCYPSEYVTRDKGNYLLSVARWQPDRQPRFLIDMIKRVDSNLQLVVAGKWQDANLRREFEREVTRANLQKRIHVAGSLPEEKLVELYRRARCLIYPAWNSFGFTALEAAAQGTAIVVPSRCAIWEMFKDRIHGFAVEADNLDSYVEAITRFQDGSLSSELGEQAWKRAKDYDWSHHAARLGEVLLKS